MRLLRDTSPARAACILTLLISAGVLLGWQLGLPRLRAVLAGHVAMNPTTAVTFMLAAGSLWCLTGERSARRGTGMPGRSRVKRDATRVTSASPSLRISSSGPVLKPRASRQPSSRSAGSPMPRSRMSPTVILPMENFIRCLAS